MLYELTWIYALVLIGTGLLSGFINTIAGGGSMLTLPALMILGLPADVANGTNRIGILLQGIAGSWSFYKKDKLPLPPLYQSLWPTLSGSLLGALLASYLPVYLLKPTLLITMFGMAGLMIIKPSMVPSTAPENAVLPKGNTKAMVGLFLTGVYGGFVQVGIGFLLLAVYAGILRFDLLRANALKMAITTLLTVIAVCVFAFRGQILLIPGLLLAIGSIAGALLSVRFAIKVPQAVLKWTMFIMILAVCIAAYFN